MIFSACCTTIYTKPALTITLGECDAFTLTHLEAGRATSKADIAPLFRTHWEVATEAEKTLLIAIAGHYDADVEGGAVAAEMGVDTEALDMVQRS